MTALCDTLVPQETFAHHAERAFEPGASSNPFDDPATSNAPNPFGAPFDAPASSSSLNPFGEEGQPKAQRSSPDAAFIDMLQDGPQGLLDQVQGSHE